MADEEGLYDEFGTYLGDDGSEEESEDDASAQRDGAQSPGGEAQEEPAAELMEVDQGPSNAVILHEDKQYYPRAQEVYGDDVEIQVQEEDTQLLTEPIIKPADTKKFSIEEAELPHTFYSKEYMNELMRFPEMVRNVALAGHLHHGKTAFMDMLVLETHDISERLDSRRGRRKEEDLRYTDTLFMERQRGISIKSSPMTFLLSNTSRKSHVFNIIDTPGHVNFVDEVAASCRLADGIILLVDVVEGVQTATEMVIRHAIKEDLPMVLVINKLDRLILELKLPPGDAYFKIKHTIGEVNAFIDAVTQGQGASRRLSPELGNVAFSDATVGWCFTIQSFAKYYAMQYDSADPKTHVIGFDSSKLALRLWGDIFYNPQRRSFTRKGVEPGAKRSFVSLILDPLYKLYSHTISKDPEPLAALLETLNIFLKPSELKMDAKPLLRQVCQKFFGPCHGFVDMVLEHIPSPLDGAKRFAEHYYTGPPDSKLAQDILKCDSSVGAPLVMQVCKLYNTGQDQRFAALARILSGTATPGQQVLVCGEEYTVDDEEDSNLVDIENTWIAESRYQLPTSGVPAGNWVLLGGIDESITKTATILPPELAEEGEAHIFSPINHMTECVFKVAIEPINPKDLTRMLFGMRCIKKSYPLAIERVEESGEHILIGTGEAYMDCVMYDMRERFARVDIKVSDPVTRFCETVAETSAIQVPVISANGKNRMIVVAEPLDEGIAYDIESGAVNIKDSARVVGKFFQENHGYDLLASRNIWSFGPGNRGSNMLQNDCLPSDVPQKLLNENREFIRQGFQWTCREGPLCEEPLRNVKFRVMNMQLAEKPLEKGGGQIIPLARRACNAAMLLSQPRLMEPIFAVTIIGPGDAVKNAYFALQRRRGHVLEDHALAGTPLFVVKGLLPVIDSFGFETDLKILTQGQATVSTVFDRWQVVSGDPMDPRIKTRPLEPATGEQLARDFVLKTRRRKGLNDDLGIQKYIDEDLYKALQASGVLMEDEVVEDDDEDRKEAGSGDEDEYED